MTHITTKGRNLILLENKSNKNDFVKYFCKNCGNFDKIRYQKLETGSGCNTCGRRITKIKQGINDLCTTNPEICDLLVDKNQGFNLTNRSNRKVLCKCPNCKYVKNVNIYKLHTKGFRCPQCSDGFSYPNKFIFSILSQLNINFLTEKTFNWSEGKRYDFYLPEQNIIIEVHGAQHYSEQGYKNNSLKKIKNNDTYKKELAKQNNIKQYIVLDCRESTKEFIKTSIINSSLNLDYSKIDWNHCDKISLSSVYDRIISLWKEGKSQRDICNILKISKPTVIKYLKKGNKYQDIYYSPQEEMVKSNTRNRKKVTRILDKKTYNSISDCAKDNKITRKKVRKRKDLFIIQEI